VPRIDGHFLAHWGAKEKSIKSGEFVHSCLSVISLQFSKDFQEILSSHPFSMALKFIGFSSKRN